MNEKFKSNIKITYSIGAKSHTEEFKAYCLLGMWLVRNWKRINKIIDIQVN